MIESNVWRGQSKTGFQVNRLGSDWGGTCLSCKSYVNPFAIGSTVGVDLKASEQVPAAKDERRRSRSS